jgi:hypothetical protein
MNINQKWCRLPVGLSQVVQMILAWPLSTTGY